MSDHSDVLYDPNDHTHTSCVKDVGNADMIILMIGSRFGGKAVSQALQYVDFDVLTVASSSQDLLSEKSNISITQLEILRSVEVGIPLFAFVDKSIYADHHVYQANKSVGIAEKIKYPSVDKPETAKYIFEFINFITHRVANNAIVPYDSFSDIENYLLKQWSMLFQRLLREQRDLEVDRRRADVVIEQIEGLKAAVLQSISGGKARETAKAVIRYRRVVDILLGLNSGPNKVDVINFTGSFEEVLLAFGIVEIRESVDMVTGTFLVLEDRSFFQMRMPGRVTGRITDDWSKFSKLDKAVKDTVVEAVSDADNVAPVLRYNRDDIDEYLEKREAEGGRRANSFTSTRLVPDLEPVTTKRRLKPRSVNTIGPAGTS